MMDEQAWFARPHLSVSDYITLTHFALTLALASSIADRTKVVAQRTQIAAFCLPLYLSGAAIPKEHTCAQVRQVAGMPTDSAAYFFLHQRLWLRHVCSLNAKHMRARFVAVMLGMD